jgi:hypothetical protein
MSALEHEAIWEKSRVFIRRAIAARDAGEFDGFCFWCALSLEVLGKAALASIHPALIADPQDPGSLFLACGKPMTSNPKTILAKTVFARLQMVSAEFGQTETDFCARMMQRRNAELHSGALPFHGLRPDSWASKFWQVSRLILQVAGRRLEDWVGPAEAARATDLINRAATVREQMVHVRIEAARALFEDSHPTAALKNQIRRLALHGQLVSQAGFGHLVGDKIFPQTCPACGCDGKVSAEKVGESEPDWEGADLGSGVVLVKVSYAPLAFRCGVCILKLDGQDQLVHADLAAQFEIEEEQEIDFDEPYLNE